MDEAPSQDIEATPSLGAVLGYQLDGSEDKELARREKLLELRLKEIEISRQELELEKQRFQLRVEEKQAEQTLRIRGRDHFWGIAITLITLFGGIGFAALDKEIGFYLLGTGGTSGAITAYSINQQRSTIKKLESDKNDSTNLKTEGE